MILLSRQLAALSLVPLIVLAACQDASQRDDSAEGALAGARIGGPFTLTDQNGRSVRWDDFRGKYRLVYFGYSYCPDVCPIDLQNIMQGYRLFARAAPDRAAKIVPIFISIDPERDTPATLKSYAAAFDPRLVALTGSPAAIAAVAKDFVVVYGKEKAANGGKDYLVSHSRTPYLFGPMGDPVALVPVDDPGTAGKQEGTPDEIAAALERWVK